MCQNPVLCGNGLNLFKMMICIFDKAENVVCNGQAWDFSELIWISGFEPRKSIQRFAKIQGENGECNRFEVLLYLDYYQLQTTIL